MMKNDAQYNNTEYNNTEYNNTSTMSLVSTCRFQASLTKQKGVVLFFSLIALVVMSLAAVALIRSVDTNNQIAGNLGFKQSTMFSSDTGINNAMTWVNSAGRTALLTDSAANGYYASFNAATNVRGFLDTADPGTDVPASVTDSQGNTIIYVINRMCDGVGDPSLVNCLRGPVSTVKDDHGRKDPAFLTDQPTVMYRITARVTGPKNTVSYLQTFVY